MTKNIQEIRERLANAEVGATVGFSSDGDDEVFHKVCIPFLKTLEEQGVLKIINTTRENRSGHRYIAVAAVKRLR